MYRKILFVLLLASAVGGFLYLKSYPNPHIDQPNFEDRLPKADFLGRCYLLDVARETSGMMFYNKIPFRDFFSQEFLLSQGKSYGLNLQKPLYFFANENGSWGVMIEVTDSSKISAGIQRLAKIIQFSDTTVFEQKVHHFEQESGFLTYDKSWLFLYKGNQFQNELKQILFARRNGIASCWKDFLNEKQFKNEKLVIYSNWSKMKEQGIEKALFAHDSDSSSFTLLTYIRNAKKLKVKMKKDGFSWVSNRSTNKLVNIHLDISDLRKSPKDPLYKFLVKMGRKISFPTVEFLNAWNGDLSFLQGGSSIVQEEYIKSELDDEFHVVEVKSTKDVVVPGFSLLFSVNENYSQLMNRLFAKGLLRKDQAYFRFFTSPQLKLEKKDNYFLFYSGLKHEKISKNTSNRGLWNEKGTKLGFNLDSLSRYEIFGTIHIPVDRLIRRSKFF
jgi:hypothetical protein